MVFNILVAPSLISELNKIFDLCLFHTWKSRNFIFLKIIP